MAPRKKDHSKDLRSLIVKHHQNRDSHLEVSSNVLFPPETIRYIVRKYKETKCIGNVFGCVRKRKTADATDRLIVCKIKSNRRLSAHKVKTKIESELRISLNVNTIPNRVYEAGLFGRVALKKSLANKVNRRKQLKYSKGMLNKSVRFWETIIWSEKSNFNLFGSDGKVLMWRTPKEKFDFKCIVLTRDGTLPLLY